MFYEGGGGGRKPSGGAVKPAPSVAGGARGDAIAAILAANPDGLTADQARK